MFFRILVALFLLSALRQAVALPDDGCSPVSKFQAKNPDQPNNLVRRDLNRLAPGTNDIEHELSTVERMRAHAAAPSDRPAEKFVYRPRFRRADGRESDVPLFDGYFQDAQGAPVANVTIKGNHEPDASNIANRTTLTIKDFRKRYREYQSAERWQKALGDQGYKPNDIRRFSEEFAIPPGVHKRPVRFVMDWSDNQEVKAKQLRFTIVGDKLYLRSPESGEWKSSFVDLKLYQSYLQTGEGPEPLPALDAITILLNDQVVEIDRNGYRLINR